MNKFIIDASAVLVFLNQETGYREISKYMKNSAINSVNLSEVIGKLDDYGVLDRDIEKIIYNLGLEVVDFDFALAFQAGILKKKTKERGLSIGDRACIATGIIKKLPVITSDKIWIEIDLPVKIILCR